MNIYLVISAEKSKVAKWDAWHITDFFVCGYKSWYALTMLIWYVSWVWHGFLTFQNCIAPPFHLNYIFFINSWNNQNCFSSFFQIPFHNSSLIWNLEVIILSFSSWIGILKHAHKPHYIVPLLLFWAFFSFLLCFATFSSFCFLSQLGDRGHAFCWCLIAYSTRCLIEASAWC